MKFIRLYVFLFCCIGLFFPATAGEDSATLTVQVTGLEPVKGQVLLSVFSSSDNFLKKPLIELTQTAGETDTVVFSLENLEAGTYAISVIYDTDKNGKLNTGFMGIPTEKVGFSNNAKGRFGPPSFKKTSFEFSGSQKIVINVGKAKK